MTLNEIIINHLKQVRRRSTMLWESLPKEYYNWKPDNDAMTAIELIRHVLQADYGWNIIINQGDMTNYTTPWENLPYTSVQDELEFASPHRQTFLDSIKKFTQKELEEIQIIHPGNGEKKNLAAYLLRIGYHESVHAGQFLSYLRAMGIDRPFIWD
ncbi:DinB family protein [Flavobacterium rakeshii]|uniref:DinB family protein n=1 Tax=Flavobacterium rakeshii TaxID=1038845 RepID=A0A6N8H9L6_9FLAO|nr:DinB family protein [Flavobacterium rakeshii]MUV03121.1 DinB family protein [Flavobacterium rakeshii]